MSGPVCRFAPSPTGFLHIGGARTALFNWLFARHHGGKFRLRIEDTDRQRSTPEAVEAILNGLRWLELEWDDEVVYQFARAARHAEVAHELLRQGKAYRCYCTPEELEEMRAKARAEGRPPRYDGRWRERDPADAPPGVSPAIRIKAPQSGETVIRDLVQGDVVIKNDQLDDMILLRGDGTPVYMLSVVVDDHDMDVTHVIRGDDHLNNAARQMMVIEAMGWPVPVYAHIPLIHGPDGAKLSKRHGALAVEAYRDMGYLPESMRNYLLRLGWAHGDDEIISTAQAIEWFDLDAVGRSASRFDFAKLGNLNGHYIRERDDASLTRLTIEQLGREPGRTLSPEAQARIAAGMPGLKQRAKTIVELAESAEFYCHVRPIPLGDAARKILTDAAKARLRALAEAFAVAGEWTAPSLEAATRAAAEAAGAKLGEFAQPLRAALTGSNVSPPIFEVLAVLGRAEALGRIGDALA
ncbi:MAG: glutamate--tRNA ligase [Alphaproteobacteria bacterium]|nr:glutamate--tRNA ligase [Alphaproteobacteria bacterium]